jgi:chemotaxis protein MotB
MKQTILALAAVLVLASCGTSKKLKSANAQIETLNSKVNDLNKQVDDQNKQVAQNQKTISELKAENLQYSKEAENCRKIEEAIRQKKAKLDQALAARGTSLEQIEAKAEDAVKKLQDAGCEVTYKNGRFHIALPDNYTYQKGSASVGPKGREALNVVAQVMYDNPGIQTMIVGNTDTTHVKGVADNWSLSTERANAVVRILSDMYNINPKRLTAAGRSKFNPIAANDTPEGMQKNRRIEIIMNPDLDRIWDLIED